MERLKALFVVALVSAALSSAQDQRDVKEPRIPEACVTLTARADIQKALAACPKGKGVYLNGTFHSGPIQLRPGITLVVTKGSILYGSRNPRDYDVTPGSCGIVDGSGRGCRPLISADRAPDSGVMGEGIIDGQGGEK